MGVECVLYFQGNFHNVVKLSLCIVPKICGINTKLNSGILIKTTFQIFYFYVSGLITCPHIREPTLGKNRTGN
jgi:hypothetical protein